MQTQTKRFKACSDEAGKERQLSGLINIISNNLLLATEVLNTEYKINAVNELEALSRKARLLAKELMSESDASKEELANKLSFLKHKMLDLVASLSEELSKLDSNKSSNHRAVEDLIVARRLLRESQRGLATIQD